MKEDKTITINVLEGEIISAIDRVFNKNWWINLSKECQEAIRDEIFHLITDLIEES